MATADREFNDSKILDALQRKTGLMLGEIDAGSLAITVYYSRGLAKFNIDFSVTIPAIEADEILFTEAK